MDIEAIWTIMKSMSFWDWIGTLFLIGYALPAFVYLMCGALTLGGAEKTYSCKSCTLSPRTYVRSNDVPKCYKCGEYMSETEDE